MTIKIGELLNNAKTLLLQDSLRRLQAQEALDTPDYSVIRQVLLQVKPLQEGSAIKTKEERQQLDKVIKLAQTLLEGEHSAEDETEAQAKTEAKTEAQEGQLLTERIQLLSLQTLQEAVVTDSGQNVFVNLIDEGWSLNGRYYPRKVIESLPRLLGNAGKVFLNHLFTKEQLEKGRDLKDWAAQITESSTTPHSKDPRKLSLGGKIHIFDRPHGWLQERVQKFPDQVGLSISAFAKVKEGTAEGKKGMIVEEITEIESFDFVTRPAAGGKVLRIAAGLTLDELAQSHQEEPVSLLTDSIKATMAALKENLKKILKKDDTRRKYWDTQSALSTAFREIANLPGKKEDEKYKMYGEVLDEFKEIMMELPLVDIFKSGSTYESVLSRKEGTGDVEYTDLTVESLAAHRPDLVKGLKDGFEAEVRESEATKAREKELQDLKDRNKILEDQESQRNAQAQAAARVTLVDTKLKEAKLPEVMVDEQFRKDLLEAKDEAEIDSRIKRQQEIWAKASGTKPDLKNGPDSTQPPVLVEKKTESEEQPKPDRKAITTKAFANQR